MSQLDSFKVERAVNGGFVVASLTTSDPTPVGAFTSAGDLIGWLAEKLDAKKASEQLVTVHIDHVSEAYKAVTNDVPSAPRWMTWAGGARPVKSGARVEVELRNGEKMTKAGGDLDWQHYDSVADIIRYRVIA